MNVLVIATMMMMMMMIMMMMMMMMMMRMRMVMVMVMLIDCYYHGGNVSYVMSGTGTPARNPNSSVHCLLPFPPARQQPPSLAASFSKTPATTYSICGEGSFAAISCSPPFPPNPQQSTVPPSPLPPPKGVWVVLALGPNSFRGLVSPRANLVAWRLVIHVGAFWRCDGGEMWWC